LVEVEAGNEETPWGGGALGGGRTGFLQGVPVLGGPGIGDAEGRAVGPAGGRPGVGLHGHRPPAGHPHKEGTPGAPRLHLRARGAGRRFICRATVPGKGRHTRSGSNWSTARWFGTCSRQLYGKASSPETGHSRKTERSTPVLSPPAMSRCHA